jgi:Spy/CpxP family protein refolding chaperone
MSRTGRVRAALAVASLLIIGAAAGIMADRTLHGGGGAHAAERAEVEKDPIGAMEREFDLRPDQKERIAAILAKRQADLDAAWEDARAHLNATLESVINEIAAVLDPDQARRFIQRAHEIHGTPLRIH